MGKKLIYKHKPYHVEARLFLGTLADAEDVKDWASGTEISWAPVDENYLEPELAGPDLTKGVELDIVSHMGFQTAKAGEYLVKDQLGVTVLTEELLDHYYEEVP